MKKSDGILTGSEDAVSRRQELIISKLHEDPNLQPKDLVKPCGCSIKTIHRDYRSDRVRKALAEIVRDNIGSEGIRLAGDVLMQALKTGKPADRLRAALWVLEKMLFIEDEADGDDGQKILDKLHELSKTPRSDPGPGGIEAAVAEKPN